MTDQQQCYLKDSNATFSGTLTVCPSVHCATQLLPGPLDPTNFKKMLGPPNTRSPCQDGE